MAWFVHVAALALIGLSAGVLGTIVGLGGAFVVIPVLRLGYAMAPAETAAVSLVIVLANSISGSIAYLRQRRADVPIAALVAVTGVPGSLLGAYLVRNVSVASFDLLYAAMLLYFFFDVMRRRNDTGKAPRLTLPGLHERSLVDAYGETFTYYTSVPLVLACGVGLGLISSFFGIGGGLMFLMFFIAIFRMPPHVLIATSTVAILFTSPAGVVAHALAHDIDWNYALPLAFGGLVGGQIGPRIALRLSTPRLLTLLATMILVAALTLIVKHVPFSHEPTRHVDRSGDVERR